MTKTKKASLPIPLRIEEKRKQRNIAIVLTVIEAVILLIIYTDLTADVPFVCDWTVAAHDFFKELIFGTSKERLPIQAFFCEAETVIKDSLILSILSWLVMLYAPVSLICDLIGISVLKAKLNKKSPAAPSPSESQKDENAKSEKKTAKKAPAPTKLVFIKGAKSPAYNRVKKAGEESIYKDSSSYVRVQKLAKGDDMKASEELLPFDTSGQVTFKDTLDGNPFYVRIIMGQDKKPYIDGEAPVALERFVPVIIFRNTRDINDPDSDIPQYAMTWIGGLEG